MSICFTKRSLVRNFIYSGQELFSDIIKSKLTSFSIRCCSYRIL